ncbi:ABC transporter ATP-binding protein [Lactiplantibacillus paraplantarum]|uniref:ATP-binding cassette domain-containing protein n=1 Tax=Lactiplantibacillus paraplantarum TaxID=60520 RepID=UPI0021A8221F|nr:ABC transporter ATP-binding protein [Lactiplantibacillus paraplantarum]MCT4457907.1 ABC transporter ATP-binding protein [Lactiplantibacillus paraplantarum]
MSIQVKTLSKRIDNRDILRGITFTWQPGRIVGLVGRNGVGKTTLFRTMADHYLADEGELVIDGQSVLQQPQCRQKLFYIDTQHHFFGGQRLRQIITTYALAYDNFDQPRLMQLLAVEQLSIKSYYQQLSKGQQMLFQILLALASNVPYIILDEPFDGLDILVRERIVAHIVDEVAERGTSFLISSHNLDELDGLCDQVLFLQQHELVADYDLENLRATARKFQLVFADKNVPAVVKEHGQLIKVYGRVLEVYFANYTPAIEMALQQAQPLMMAAQPLTITDVFRVKLGNRQAVWGGV